MRIRIAVAVMTVLGLSSAATGQDIFRSIQNGDLKAVREVIERDPDQMEIQDRNQMTPLMYASFGGQLEVAAYLVGKGADVNYHRGGESCLHQAAQMNHREVAALLLDHGADIEMMKPRTALYYALSSGAREAAELLIARGAVVPVSPYLLHRAVRKGIGSAVDRMIAGGVDLLSSNDAGGSLLHSAAEGGMVPLTELMLERDVDVDARDRYGRTALHLAAREGHLAIVRQLLRHGATRDLATPTGATAYDLARGRGHDELCDWLVEQGAAARDLRLMTAPGDPYFGQTPPGERAEFFSMGIISSADELEHGVPAWSPSGDEIYWSTLGRTYEVRRVDRRWTLPEVSSLYHRYGAKHVAFSPDGRRMFFDSKSTMEGNGKQRDSDIWVMERSGGGWTEPRNAGPAVNSTEDERSVSIAQSGNLYFASGYDLFRSVYRDGRYMPREKLGNGISTEHLELGCLVAPDESYLLLTSSRPGADGEEAALDTYISVRNADGSWTEPRPFGREHGVVENFFIGRSPDGRYLFFGAGDVQWIDARIILRLTR